MASRLPEGTTIRMLLLECDPSDGRLTGHRVLGPRLEEAVRACEMTPLGQVGHDFPEAGFSLCLLLAESHLAVHTYPECTSSVVVELTVCDYLRPNRERARRLARKIEEIFRPARSIVEEIEMAPGLPVPDVEPST
jgi:S-adenosylmethionine/arginine decarboxylase-like enzyme